MFIPEVPEQHIPGIHEDDCSREHAALQRECGTTHTIRMKRQHVREKQVHCQRNHISDRFQGSDCAVHRFCPMPRIYGLSNVTWKKFKIDKQDKITGFWRGTHWVSVTEHALRIAVHYIVIFGKHGPLQERGREKKQERSENEKEPKHERQDK